jgi:proteasome accessory factor A
MATRLIGLEAELAASATRGGAALPAAAVAAALEKIARRTLVHLPGGATRMFLPNGGLVYVDCGNHPEAATPECTTPWEAVAHLRAAERIVGRVAAAAAAELDADAVRIGRTNVDYVSGSTWGCHESFSGALPVQRYKDWLVAHLATRIVYTGAGGLDPSSPGIRFSLSPRAAFMEHAVGHESTGQRGIFHTRDEALCNGYSRVHVLAGDNACSQRATWLKAGTTALVVALAEAAGAAQPPVLHDPVRAMKTFARDLQWRALVRSARGAGTRMTAVEVQRELLAQAEAHARSPRMPPWAPEVRAAWRAALDLVESGAIRTSQGFDWPLKHALLRREIARRGYTEAAVGAWSEAVERVWNSTRAHCDAPGPPLVDAARIDTLRRHSLIGDAELAAATRVLEAQGQHWRDLDAFNDLRHRLCALDVHFGVLGSGIFDTLDRAGVIAEHRVVSEAMIEQAAEHPPPGSRAAARGHWVRRLAGRRRRYVCDWRGIRGLLMHLDLSDPFATEGRWRRLGASERAALRGSATAADLFARVVL